MVAELDAMLDQWRGGFRHGAPTGEASGSEASPRSHKKPPAVYAIGIIDFQSLSDIDRAGAEDLVDEAKRRLERLVRSGDALGTAGPDTFLLATGEMEPATAGAVMDRIRGALAMPLEIGGGPVSLTVAIGVAFAFDDEHAEDMITEAESDMHRVMDH